MDMPRRRIIQVALNLDREFDRRLSASIDARPAWMGISALLREALAEYLFGGSERGQAAQRYSLPDEDIQDMPRAVPADVIVAGSADQAGSVGDPEEIEDVFGDEIAITRSAET